MTRPSIEQQVTFLYTRDLEKTAAFYEDTLGLPLVLDQGICRIYRASGDAFLGFCQHMDAPERPYGVILTLVSQEVDAWHDFLRQRGVTIEKPPTHNPQHNIYHLFLRDPNGYLVEIQRFLDPVWPKEKKPGF